MFSFFNRNRSLTAIKASDIHRFLNQGLPNPQIDFWVDDQILFQVMHGKHFVQHGFQAKADDFVLLHCFNKHKTKTQAVWEKFRNNHWENPCLYYEAPKGIHNYLEVIGADPANMELQINRAIASYEVDPKYKIRFEMLSY
ncbi:MAG: hypothetical protein ACFB10_21520 [Salibacteraceae bacterium]